MDNLQLYNKVRQVPANAQKKITGGRINGFTDINPIWRIKTLTETFGPCGYGWYYEITRETLEAAGDEVAAFVDINLYVRLDGEWSKPIPGTGGSAFVAREKSGLRVSDECYKMALTDAISVACKALGIGADVYWASDSTKYNQPEKDQGQLEDQESSRTGKVTEAMCTALYGELARTGIGKKGLLANYQVKDVQDMTVKQYKDAMDKLGKKPDRQEATRAPEEAVNQAAPLADAEDELPWK